MMEDRLIKLEQELGLWVDSDFKLSSSRRDDNNVEPGEDVHSGVANKKQLDVESSLNRLTSYGRQVVPRSLREDWEVIRRLEEELNPGSLMTHQASILGGSAGRLTISGNSADLSNEGVYTVNDKPLFYRREEILAWSKEFKKAMQSLSRMQELLAFGLPSSSTSSKNSLQLPHSSRNDVALSMSAKRKTDGQKDRSLAVRQDRDYASQSPILHCNQYVMITLPTVQQRLDKVATKLSDLMQRIDTIRERMDIMILPSYYNVMMTASEKFVLFDEMMLSKEQEKLRLQEREAELEGTG